MRGRDKFKRMKFALMMMSRFYGMFPRKIREKLLVWHRKTTGYFGFAVRYALVHSLAKHVGDNVSIHPDVYLLNTGNLIIGDNVSIHPMTYIDAWGGVSIGSDVSIAHNVSMISFNHGYADLETPIKDQVVEPRSIIVGNNVWIGAKAMILGNVVLGEGTVVGAASVVTKSTEENVIVTGVPAKKTRSRG